MSLTPSLEIFKFKAYRNYWFMRQLNSAGRQMQAVAVGWQVYNLARETRGVEESALLLGFIGLTQFLPALFLSLVGGQAADRYNRKLILMMTVSLKIVLAGFLILSVFLPTAIALNLIFVTAAMIGVSNAFAPAAGSSLFPLLVPKENLPDAIAWNSLGFQFSAILGPAIGGFIYIAGPQYVYSTVLLLGVLALISISLAQTPKHIPKENVRGLHMIIEGLKYVHGNKIVLGAISLDLVVVLFGGVTALLPIFAKDVLHVGAGGLGVLRAAPALGAMAVAYILATKPLTRHIGRYLLLAIFIYGLGILGFAFSKVLALSFFALAVTGAADMVSVYIRQSIILLATPDKLRGRVTSVDFIFISASNELGEFESGVAARYLGPIGAVILGGTIAIVAAITWPKIFPDISKIDSIDRNSDN